MKQEIRVGAIENTMVKKPESRGKSPYMSKSIYNNYAKVMKEKNQNRKEQGLTAIHIRSFEEWSNA